MTTCFRRTARLLPLLVAGVTGGLAGCDRDRGPAAEPTGGDWTPMLVGWSEALALPAPPAPLSDREREDLTALAQASSQRTAETIKAAEFWRAGASIRWNEIARELVARHRIEHAPASRVYALLSVAQYDALVAAWRNKYLHGRSPPASEHRLWPQSDAGDPGYPCGHSTAAAASAVVLSHLFPGEAQALEARAREHHQALQLAGMAFRSDTVAGDVLGRRVGAQVIERARGDGSSSRWDGEIPAGPGRWQPAGDDLPVTPHWSQVKPWLLHPASRFRAPPPPAFDSPEYRRALTAVRTYSDAPSQQQRRETALWADGPGSYTPAGRWNQMAAGLIQEARLGELRSARVFALLNVALMDAGIACWDSKYHHSFVRPWQADDRIATPVGQPNHPSYPSAHAAFSGAGSAVLGYLFPQRAQWLRQRAEQAALSREYGGLHYRFDSQAGLEQGRAVAQLAIARGRRDGAP